MDNIFPLDESPSFCIYRADTEGSTLLRRTLRATGYDLTPEQCFVLVRLAEIEEGPIQAELAKRFFKDPHSITRIIDVLEQRGFIERRSEKSNRRIFRIFVTEKGGGDAKGAYPNPCGPQQSHVPGNQR